MVELAFHTDTRGSERYNLMFSQRVMDYLKATLVEKGIDSLRIISRGYGERFPVIPPGKIIKLTSKEEIENAHRINRRIEIIIRDHFFELDDSVFSCGSVYRMKDFISSCNLRIRPDGALEINRIYDFLVKNNKISIEIGYHTDQRGSAEYNQKYSQLKAEIVSAYLIERGIDPRRLVSKGYGESQALISQREIFSMPKEDQEKAYSENRRFEFKILNTL